jgi:FixJ family two-component response regulator
MMDLDRGIVLVIDDDKDIGAEICDALFLRNIRAVHVSNVIDARAVLKADEHIGIITVDYHMPGMNGGEVMETLKSEFARPFVFIMVTGDGSQSVAVEALRAQALDFLAKPIDPRLLLAAIRRAQDRLKQETEMEDLQLKLQTETQTLSERLGAISGKLRDREILLRQLLQSERAAMESLTEELRTPLAPLLAHLKTLKDELHETGSHREAAVAQSTMQHGLKLAEVVEAIFGNAPDSVSDGLKCVPLDMNDMIKRIAPALRRAAADKQVQFKVRIPASLPYLYADQGRLARALSDIAVGLIEELSASDHISMMAMVEERTLVTSFRISAAQLDEKLLVALTSELSHSLEGLDNIKPSISKFISARIVVHLHGGQISIDDPHSPLRLIKLRFPLPDLEQAPPDPAHMRFSA